MQTPTQYIYGDEGEDEHWLRQLTLPEEWIIRDYPSARGGYYRWFESGNVIDLMRVRRQRAKQANRSGGSGGQAA